MKPLLALVALSTALALSPVQAATTKAQDATASTEHQHEAHAATSPTSTPTPGKRWATDAPLREGMGRIRKSVEELGHFASGHLSASQANDLAAGIEKDVNFLIANCKLEPEADAALHLIIAKLLQGAQAIKTDPADAKGMELLHAAVADYERSFDEAPVASG